ncbi:DUF58 domain-containing protein [Candidatus Woesearchaeota archaeon]|nr:DUF58 domain-containing protein [Candidatus Woesearchaeota archaeon]
MIDTSFLRQLDRFDIVLKKRVLSAYSGQRQSKNLGAGAVFFDYKDYVPGDDFRAIDWHVYARTESFFIRRYEEERNVSIHVIVDSSASMDFGAKITKYEYASMIAIGFSYMALRNNERFEVSTFADRLNLFRSKKGVSKLAGTVDILNRIVPKGHSKFQECLEQYKQGIRNKSLIVIISDFLFDPHELEATLTRFRRNDVIVVQVLDKSERDFLLEGDMILEDSETSDSLRTMITNRLVENYADSLLNHIYALKGVCDGFGAKFLSVSTDTPIFDTFYTLLGDGAEIIL